MHVCLCLHTKDSSLLIYILPQHRLACFHRFQPFAGNEYNTSVLEQGEVVIAAFALTHPADTRCCMSCMFLYCVNGLISAGISVICYSNNDPTMAMAGWCCDWCQSLQTVAAISNLSPQFPLLCAMHFPMMPASAVPSALWNKVPLLCRQRLVQ